MLRLLYLRYMVAKLWQRFYQNIRNNPSRFLADFLIGAIVSVPPLWYGMTHHWLWWEFGLSLSLMWIIAGLFLTFLYNEIL